MIKKIVSILLFGFYSSFVMSQTENSLSCGTIFSEDSQAYINSLQPKINAYKKEYYKSLQQKSSTVITSVPIKVHIIRTSLGTGGLSTTDLNDAIAVMNSYYANAFLEFFICEGINYIDNDNFYDFETDDEASLISAHNVTDLINIYFTDNVEFSSNGSAFCGYADPPGNDDIIVINNTCATNGSTLPHEMGHFFSLYHTHGLSNSVLTDELVDGSNCDTAGDFICDTPADPLLSNANVTVDCNYIGTTLDANFMPFSPDTNNIMSYSRKDCRTSFSPEQYATIFATYHTVRNNFACSSFSVDFSANISNNDCDLLTVEFTDNSVGATSWQWDVNGDDIIDYTTQNPIHTYTEPLGHYDVALTVSNGLESISKVYPKYIYNSKTSISDTSITIDITTDNNPEEITWQLEDITNTTILASGGPYTTTGNYQTNIAIPANSCLMFTINDSGNNGLTNGNGEAKLIVSGNTIFSTQNYTDSDFVSITNGTLALKDFEKSNFRLFPNPTSNYLSIQSSSDEYPTLIEVYSIQGQLILRQPVLNESHLKIDTSQLSNGMYFLKLIKDTKQVTLPFIKNNL